MAQNTGYTTSMNRLIQLLGKLPGIGQRSAQRMAFHLLRVPLQDVNDLAAAISQLRQATRLCPVTFNLCEGQRCLIYDDPERDRGLILVVEHPSDLMSIEAAGMFKGVYHVLWGRLAPLDGIGAGDLTIDALLKRITTQTQPPVREVVLGTNPTLEGDGTALYLSEKIEQLKTTQPVKVTRLARGLPTGYELDRAGRSVLMDALQHRQSIPSHHPRTDNG